MRKLTHLEHALATGIRGCTAFTMGSSGCTNCGWQYTDEPGYDQTPRALSKEETYARPLGAAGITPFSRRV